MADAARMPMKPQHSTQSPGDEREIAGIIARLLLHFYSPSDLSESARKAMAQDWVEDLREFGAGIVADACREWRNTQTNRPAPADIRLLCIAAQRLRQESQAHRALSSPTDYRVAAARDDDRRMQEAKYEHARQVRESMAAELGYPSFSYMLSIGLVHAVNNSRRRHDGPTAADLGVRATEQQRATSAG